MRDAALPVEFSALLGRVSNVNRVSSAEWSSSCPQCGGAPHKDGSYPDRFRMWTKANGKNKVMGWCRRCSYVWFPTFEKPMSKEEFEAWRKEQLAIERERKLAAERAIALLQSQKIWVQYHSRLNTWAIETLTGWGISPKWQEYWQLGLMEDYTVHGKEEYHSPAITIPVWQLGGAVSNVKLRVLNPKNSNDRYRSLYKTGEGQPFVAWNRTKFDDCLIVEGEKKAMVTAIHSKRDVQIIGVPTKTPSKEMLQKFSMYGKIYLCLDPDASQEEKGINALTRMANMLGRERVAVIKLPGKIDDLIVQHGLNVSSALKYAKKLET